MLLSLTHTRAFDPPVCVARANEKGRNKDENIKLTHRSCLMRQGNGLLGLFSLGLLGLSVGRSPGELTVFPLRINSVTSR